MQVTRKSFLQAAAAIVGGSTLGVAACGDDSGSGGSSTTSTSTSGSGSSSSKSGSGSSSSSGSGSGSSSSTSGSTSGSGSSSSSGGMLTCTPSIATNHPQAHTMTVTAQDVADGVDKTYDIMGASLHAHSVTLTAADFTMLSQGGTVMKTSTLGGDHTHVVTVTCA